MNPPIISRAQARELDRRAVEEYGSPSIVLMENAGRGVADKLCRFGIFGPVVVCCGGGNNGGDGFVIARHLDLRAISVKVLLWAVPERLRGDAAVNYRVLERSGVPIEAMADANGIETRAKESSWIVDALLGTGFHGEPRPPLDDVIAALNRSKVPIVAVDVPSGLDCDTGRPSQNTIRATHTCTFVAAKPGFFAPGADAFTGQVHIVDIGAPRKLVDEILRQPKRA